MNNILTSPLQEPTAIKPHEMAASAHISAGAAVSLSTGSKCDSTSSRCVPAYAIPKPRNINIVLNANKVSRASLYIFFRVEYHSAALSFRQTM